jgi:hypothetical protein
VLCDKENQTVNKIEWPDDYKFPLNNLPRNLSKKLKDFKKLVTNKEILTILNIVFKDISEYHNM